MRWNGRQIRNAFQIASSLAHYELRTAYQEGRSTKGLVLDSRQFIQVSNVIRQFEIYMQKTTNTTAADQARLSTIRDDGVRKHDLASFQAGYSPGYPSSGPSSMFPGGGVATAPQFAPWRRHMAPPPQRNMETATTMGPRGDFNSPGRATQSSNMQQTPPGQTAPTNPLGRGSVPVTTRQTGYDYQVQQFAQSQPVPAAIHDMQPGYEYNGSDSMRSMGMTEEIYGHGRQDDEDYDDV